MAAWAQETLGTQFWLTLLAYAADTAIPTQAAARAPRPCVAFTAAFQGPLDGKKRKANELVNNELEQRVQ